MATRFLEVWLLPPGVIVVLLVLAGVLVIRAAARTGSGMTQKTDVVTRALGRIKLVGIGLLVLAGLLYLVSTTLLSRALIGATERAAEGATVPLSRAQAVVVLGGGLTVLDQRVPVPRSGYRGSGEASALLPPEAQARVVEGVLLATELGLPLLLSGGRVFSGAEIPAEAVVASGLARSLVFGSGGIDIVVESESRSTAENAQRVREILQADTIVLVTSAYHMRRAGRSFRRAGFTVLPAPVAYRADHRPFHPAQLLPTADALLDSATWLRELLGSLWYSLRGV